MLSVKLAKRALRLAERFPQKSDLALAQVFELDTFKQASSEQQHKIMRASARFRDEHERALPFERHFSHPLRPYLEGKDVLDLGCFTGGRTIAWHKKYNVARSYGVDVDPVFIRAARLWAAEHHVPAEFKVGMGEAIPFDSDSCDAIVSYDVFEHVRSVKKTLSECWRVLKPGGVLIAVFPPLYCPTEHHLSGVSWTPAVHWVFPKDTLFRAYREIIQERGVDARWYLPENEKLHAWEALYTLNGITVSRFMKIIRDQHWKVDELSLPLWPATIRHVYNRPVLRRLWKALGFINRIPGLREIATDRICVILRK